MANKLVQIQGMIHEIRGHKVMFDSDLANLYQVEVKTLNRAVKRNIKRFPDDFMFQLTNKEWANLRCQFDTSSLRYQNGTAKMVEKIRYNPYVFTEQGITKGTEGSLRRPPQLEVTNCDFKFSSTKRNGKP